MKSVDRADYTPVLAYQDAPQVNLFCYFFPAFFIVFLKAIDQTGQTISAPHMHAHALELLEDEIMKPGRSKAV